MDNDRKKQNDFLKSHGYNWQKGTDYSYMDDDDNFPRKRWVLRGQDGKVEYDVDRLLVRLGYYGEEKAREWEDWTAISNFYENGRDEAGKSSVLDKKIITGAIAGEYYDAERYDITFVISQDALYEISKRYNWDSGYVAYKYPYNESIAEAIRRQMIFDEMTTRQHNKTQQVKMITIPHPRTQETTEKQMRIQEEWEQHKAAHRKKTEQEKARPLGGIHGEIAKKHGIETNGQMEKAAAETRAAILTELKDRMASMPAKNEQHKPAKGMRIS